MKHITYIAASMPSLPHPSCGNSMWRMRFITPAHGPVAVEGIKQDSVIIDREALPRITPEMWAAIDAHTDQIIVA